MVKTVFLILLLGVFLLFGCHYSNEEDLIPDNGCNTVDISFANEVLPILENSCVSCHNSAGSLGGVNLENYEGVSVSAGDGSLSGSINHNEGFAPMPQGQQKLDSCNIARIDSWIMDGYPNN